MGTSASLMLCKTASAVKIKKANAKISPEALAPPPSPVFGVPLATLRERQQMVSGVPLILQHMVEFLLKYGLRQKGLFRLSGSVMKAKLLKTKYNLGEKVDLVAAGDIHAVASLLKLFVRELPQALILQLQHTEMVRRFRECLDENELNYYLKEALSTLPEDHHSTLSYLTHFLLSVASYSQENLMTLENLATIFGPCIFHVCDGPDMLEEQAVCNALTGHLLKNQALLLGGAMESPHPPLLSPLSVSRDDPSLASESREHVGSEHTAESRGTTGMCSSAVGPLFPALTVPDFMCERTTDENLMAAPDLDEEEGHGTGSQPMVDKVTVEGVLSSAEDWPSQSNNATPVITDLKEVSYSKAPGPHGDRQRTQSIVVSLLSSEREMSKGSPQERRPVLQPCPCEEEDSSKTHPSPGTLLRRLHVNDSGSFQSPEYSSGVHSPCFHDNPTLAPSLHDKSTAIDTAVSEHPDEFRQNLPTVSMSTENAHFPRKKQRRFKRSETQESEHSPSEKDNSVTLKVIELVLEPGSSHTQAGDAELMQSAGQLRKQTGEAPREMCNYKSDLQGAAMQQHRPSPQETLNAVKKRLCEKRRAHNLPESVKEMTPTQVALEKVALQKCLLYFESLHGRPATKEEKRLMKPLYDRYHTIKQHLYPAVSSAGKRGGSGGGRVQCSAPNAHTEALSWNGEREVRDDVPPVDANTLLSSAVTVRCCHERSRSALPQRYYCGRLHRTIKWTPGPFDNVSNYEILKIDIL